MVRIGKTVPTYDFGNVVRPVPVQDPLLRIPAVSGLLYTPVFVNPAILGALPGYYNSAYGVTATVAPSRRFYLSLGGYDGNVARGEQTGLQVGPRFNGYRFQIGETGTARLLGPADLPGLRHRRLGPDGNAHPIEAARCGHSGRNPRAYAFASQRLWRGSGESDARGISGFVQLGINDSRTMIATGYVGLGVTAFGVIPGRPVDSLGAGIAWSRLNRNRDLRPSETLLQFYDQIQICGAVYLQPTLTLSPNPGEKTARAPAIAFTVQSTVLF